MTEQRKDFPEFYVTSPQPCPYLKGRLERKLFTHLSHDKPDAVIDSLLRGGFRRSQNIAYVPYCESCSACISVRVPVFDFKLSKNQRRTMRRNRDVIATRVANHPTGEHYGLFRDYIATRHGEGGMADMTVQDFRLMVADSMVNTYLVEYRLAGDVTLSGPLAAATRPGKLIGVTLFDLLSDGLSLVYSFFDPEHSDRSLGRYMILENIAFARSKTLPFVYLGYLIEGSPKMRYKDEYQPQEHLSHNGWNQAPRPRQVRR